MLDFYDKFPREVSFPQRMIVRSMPEFLKLVNTYNGVKEVYSSVYSFSKVVEGKPDYESAFLDRVFFDFDGAGSYHDACVLHEHLVRNNLRHLLVFSGRGYHIYLRVKTEETLRNKKVALLNCHNYFEKLLGIKIDEKIKGDIARVSRVLNTWNTRGNRYCIPLLDEDLNKGEEHIKEISKKQYMDWSINPWHGRLLYDIKEHDNGDVPEAVELLKISDDTERKINADELLKSLPKCVSSIMAKGHWGWRGRYLVIVYLREMGHTRKEIIEILKKYLDPKELDHCLHSEKQVDYLLKQLEYQRIMFPSCKSLRGQGACPFKWDCTKSRLLYK